MGMTPCPCDTMTRLPVTRIPHCTSINAEARRQGSIAMIEGVKTVGVVGAGTMGAGVAQVFATAAIQ